MESSQGPPPEEPETPPPGGGAVGPTPPPGGEQAVAARGNGGGPPPAVGNDDKANVGLRVGAVLLALAVALGAAIMVAAMLLLGDTATCDAVRAGEALPNSDGECFDGSGAAKTASMILGWPGAVLTALAAILGLAFAIRGRGGRLFLGVLAAGAILDAVSIIAGSI